MLSLFTDADSMSNLICLERYYTGKTILITGGSGAIGSNLAEKLSRLGAARIVVFDNLCSSYEWKFPDLS